MVTVRIFANNTKAWLARSMLTSEGIDAVVADDHMNTLYFIAFGARLQVREGDEARAREILDKHTDFTPLPDDFSPPASEPNSDEAPQKIEGFAFARQWAPAAICALVFMVVAWAVFWQVMPLHWKYGFSELIKMGNAAYDKRDYDSALKYYNAALAFNPASPEAHYNRGLVYFFQQENAKAIDDFSADLAARPDDAAALAMRAKADADTGRWDQALDDANRAISLDPGSIWAYRARAQVYKNRGQ